MRKEFTCDGKDKSELRRIYSAKRAEIADKPVLAVRAAERVLPLLRGNVMVYVSIGSEMPTDALITRLLSEPTVTVYVPFTDKDMRIVPRRLRSLGSADRLGNLDETHLFPTYGVNIDQCVTPLLAFGADGSRLGYGKGCYDRFFATSDARRIGFAFDAQAACFCAEAHDVPLDCCVTETKVIYFPYARDIG